MIQIWMRLRSDCGDGDVSDLNDGDDFSLTYLFY